MVSSTLTRQTLEIVQGQRVTVLLTSWEPYCVLAAGFVGLWLMQNAFSAGPLHSSLPTIAAGEPVAGIALGIVVFGDRIQISPGELAIEVCGIAALIVGVVMVARSSAFGGLHRPGHLVHRPERPRTYRREDLNGLRPDPPDAASPPVAASPLDTPAPLEGGSFGGRRPRRVHRRPFHGPASGEEGG